MIRIRIINTNVTLEIISSRKKEKIEINNGRYKDDVYTYLVVSDSKLLLEGDTLSVVASGFDAVTISFKSVAEQLAEHFGNTEILLYGADAIPEGKEKEAISVILKNFIS